MLAEIAFAPQWIGHRVTAAEAASGARVAMLTRLGGGLLPGPDTVLQEGDLLHAVMRTDDIDRVAAVMAAAPMAGDH